MDKQDAVERAGQVVAFQNPSQPVRVGGSPPTIEDVGQAALASQAAPGALEREASSLKIKRTDAGAETVLRVEGVLDAITAKDMRSVVDKVLERDTLHVRLDLAPLRLIDSSGVGAVVSLYKKVRDKGGSVTVVGLKDQPLAVFRLLRLDHIFTI